MHIRGAKCSDGFEKAPTGAMFVIDLVANLRELHLRIYEVCLCSH